MNNILTEAKLLLANNRTDKASRDLMTTEQRDALADDYARDKHFLSASHFHSNTEQRKEFERLFWENIKLKNN